MTGPQNPVVDHTVSGDPVSAPVGWPTSERSGGAIQLYSALSESIPLPKDKAFGYALPAEVTLSHHIEASTNLIQWTEITNPALFFKDSDSTNFTHRFYRFSE